MSDDRSARLVPPTEPELRVLHRWLDSWRGVGDVVMGMARQGWDLQLTEYDAAEHWRATFFVAGQAHCADTSATVTSFAVKTGNVQMGREVSHRRTVPVAPS